MTKFIDLQRHFRDLTQKELEDPESLAYLNDAEFGSAVGWAELLTMNRVLLLAEAGSGKTLEMSEQAKRLSAEGKYAFFVAMESLDRETLVGLLSVDEERSFNVWKTDGRSPAWFFLDAVDELKLTGGKLDRALQRFSKAIDGHLGRARVIVSCRPSDWRPITDMAIFRDKVPMPEQPSQTPMPDEFFLKVLQQERSKLGESKENESENADGVRTVILLPLSTRQIELFAVRSDVHDASAFVAEIHRQNAWTFARRPLDLSELIATWTSTGQLGTRAKQHDANLTAKLKDAPDRPDNGVLSDDRAHLGAERLALALALTRTRTIKSPDQTLDAQRAEGILDAALILKDWTEKERQTLLRRALFDPATYGRVRFHHRSVQEYLAARHLKALRNKGMSTKALFRLLFAERYGEEVVLPSMRPIAAWLALWDDSVRRELTRREPEALLSAGDPGSLSIAARAELLRAFVAAYGEGSWRGLHIPIDEVNRLAHPELGPTIRELWGRGPSNTDVRELLINVIWQGPVEACSDLVKAAALDTTWDRYHRVAAVRALLACGHEKAVREIAQGLLNKAIDWPDECISTLAEDLFPKNITVDELILLMERTPEPKGTVGGFGWVGCQIVKVIEPLSNVAVELRDKLAELIWRGREKKQEFWRIRGQFNHLAPALAMLCNRQLETLSLKIDTPFIRASVIASRFAGGDTGTREPVGKLRTHFREISELRAATFWVDLALMDELVPNTDEWQRVYLASHDGLIGSIVEGDRAWLEAALADETSPERRPVALFPLLDIWKQRGRIAAEANSLRRLLKGDKALETIFANRTAPPERDANLKRMERTAEQQRKKAAAREALGLQNWTKWRKELLADPAQAFSPEKRLDTTSSLYSWLAASAPSRNRYNVWNRQALEQAFGTDVAKLAAAAFQAHWRQTQPVLWSARPAGQQNCTPYSWVYGLCGVASEATHPVWTARLTADEARTATAYATIELNGFAPFLGDLASAFPAEVEAVLGGELIAELKVGADHDHMPILQDLARADSSIKELLTPRLSAALTAWPTTSSGEASRSAGHLESVLRILSETSTEHARTAIADECARRYQLDTSGPLALVWLRGLFKFDPERGAEALSATLVASDDATTRGRAVETFASLFGEHDAVTVEISDPAVRSRVLLSLVQSAYAFVRQEDDRVHDGAYTPDTRDHAKRARGSLLSILLDTPGPEARQAILKLAIEPNFVHFPDRLRLLARGRAATDAEFEPFDPEKINHLESRYEAPPNDRDALFDVMTDRLEDLAHDIAHHDFTNRRTLRRISEETEMQRTLALRIEAKANGAYMVTREEEVADSKRTDIRVCAVRGNSKGVIEVKLADKWTLTDFERALRNQLVGQYLRHESCRAGILLLTYNGERKYWKHPVTQKHLSFPEVVCYLQEKARQIEVENPHVIRLGVLDIDLTDPHLEPAHK